MLKKSLFLLLPLLLFLFSLGKTLAFDRPHFVSFTNPVRGVEDGESKEQTPLDLPRYQYQLAKENKFPVDWLLRFDAVNNATISGYFRSISATDSSQILGAFLEVTPKLTLAAGVDYPEGEYMSQANRIFLSGYSQPDRLKLIDAYMKLFYDTFGYYPSVVGAWHLDAYSLEYLSSHYSVVAAVICDEQYSTDRYRLWGGYLGSPYFPSRANSAVPASGRNDRLNIVLTKWAQRDPFNFYGTGSESNYSTQVNDYTSQGLSTNYFANLLGIYSNGDFNEFTQTNIGLENDYSLAQYRSELKNSYQALRANQGKYDLRFVSSADFSQWLQTRYAFTNPAFFFKTADITGRKPGTVYWYQNPFYRIGIKSDGGRTEIIDFRIYNSREGEEYYLTKNISRTLYSEVYALVDSVKFPGRTISLDIDLSKAEISYSGWKITFKEGDKEFRLEPKQILFENFPAPPDLPLAAWTIIPHLPFSGSVYVLAFGILVILATASLIIIRSKKNKFVLTLGFLLGAITLVTVARSGLVYIYGLGLWGPNGHDAIFHLSLAEHFSRVLLSLNNPQINGELLKNYHFGFDWLTALAGKLTGFSLLDLYFRFVPLLIVIFLVYFLVKLLNIWRFSKFETALSLALVFLSGSAGFIAHLILARGLFGGESIFWANQSVSLLLNPPFALSILGLVIFLVFLEEHSHRLSVRELLFLSILGGVLVQIKIYAFLLLIGALFIRRKFKLFLTVSLVGFLFLLPSLAGPGPKNIPFVFNPLWFSRSMFESFDRVYWLALARAWQVYENNGVFTKLILVNLLALVVFYAGNLYLRLIGLGRIIFGREFSLGQNITRFIILLGLVIPLLFTQAVNPWNTIQFMYYSLFFLGIFTAKQIGVWCSQVKNKVVLTVIFLFFTLLSFPTTIGTLSDYLTSQSASRISPTELHALDVLRRSEKGVVVSPLTSKRYLPVTPDPKPLYAYASTAYISALTGQPEYLSDTINLDITGFDYQERAKNILRLYLTRDPVWVSKFLQANRISYIYETPLARLMIRPQDACLTKIFDSGEINLYKYSCM